ncbi:MAG: hypothetical protein KZQ93_06755 [Candidatus Thiodiazotropha sp. (ex Monitilora ramsayi)]|nr:hypothetical protein [Candidatus Thiodiazotropha sp. (ex Monitilora ramsayi)]
MEKHFKKHFSLIVISWLIVGCTATNLSKTNRNKITRINLPSPSEVIYQQEPEFRSHGQAISMAFGAAIGGAIGAVLISDTRANKTEAQLIKEYLEAEPNPFSKTLTESLSSKIEDTTNFNVTSSQESDAKLSLIVLEYGIFPVPYRKSYRPTIKLKSELTDKTGAIVWEYEEKIYSDHEITAKHYAKDLFNNIEIMKKGFGEISDFILTNMALHLAGKNIVNSSYEEDCGLTGCI